MKHDKEIHKTLRAMYAIILAGVTTKLQDILRKSFEHRPKSFIGKTSEIQHTTLKLPMYFGSSNPTNVTFLQDNLSPPQHRDKFVTCQ